MAIKLISQPEYKIGMPGFETVVFTGSSEKYLIFPQAVKFASERNAILQSACDAGAFRIEAGGADDADRYQASRTVVAYRKDGNKFYAFVDDIPDTGNNIVLCRAQEGYDSHNKQNKWVLPVNDAHVKDLLKRAEKTGRIVEVTDESPLELATKQVDGKSDFGQNDWNKAVLVDVSEPYAQMLNKRGREICRVYHLTPENLEERGVDENNAEIRWCGLGGDIYVDCVGTDDLFYDVGRARGVRGAREIVGNKGKLVGSAR